MSKVTIHCDSSYIDELVSRHTSEIRIMESRLGNAEGRLTAKADEVYDLREEIRHLRIERDNLVRPAPIPVGDDKLKELIIAVAKGEKINAIKVVREIGNHGLKEAKDLVEEAMSAAGVLCKECKGSNGAHFTWCQHYPSPVSYGG